VLGIFLVWVPVAVYLAMTGAWASAALLTTWGVACMILIDTLLYTRLAGDRMRLHPVPTLLAFVGGLAVFGAAGLVLGPGILAVTVAVLDVWRRRAATAETAETAPA
jgi:predicted PurR-regulated permease PerM